MKMLKFNIFASIFDGLNIGKFSIVKVHFDKMFCLTLIIC